MTGRPQIRAITRIKLFATEEGGRTIAIPQTVFRCLFEIEGEFFDCGLLLEEAGPLSPGQEATVPIDFLRPWLLEGRLHCGTTFRLWDLRTIAEGIVLRVLKF